MAKQTINVGTGPNSGTGDNLRSAFDKTNDNFDEVYAAGPVSTNVQISGTTISTTSTNANLTLLPDGIGNIVTSADVVPDEDLYRRIGRANLRYRVIYAGNVDVAENLVVSGNITSGNLRYTGETFQGDILADDSTVIIDASSSDGSFANVTSSGTSTFTGNVNFTGATVTGLSSGVQGAQGTTGAGTQGTQGTTGAGTQGTQGTTGTGTQGTTGTQGIQGPSSGGSSVSISDDAPGSPTAGDLWWESDTGKLKIYYSDTDSNQWVDASPSGGGGGSGLQSRAEKAGTTSSIANAAEENLDITGYKGYALMKIQTDRAARVRVYTDAASRTADASRAEGVDPTADAGVIAEVITTGAETVLISPGAIGFNNESTPTTTIPTRITNKSGGTSTVTVTLTVLQLES
ncbi:MAG: hypothetical protein VW270_17300 [Candidatus Poseidoniales archaeon]